ncbi:hybrid sensor histidine kinase/response regulator [Demequina lutea]|uniref:histidine kinase n=1 Tax=Demequina lutea TaxID=431489 RepID=A0A7Y9Z8P9_9MICO|nr:PAS domain-containing sensor histidine kinase [Demequina lutea]NYI40884.1 PAS domain S-box-containing protein [Demequina lutea]
MFVVDILLPHGYDIAYLYAVTVLVAAFSRRSKTVIRTAFGAVGLTFIAFALKKHPGTPGGTGMDVFSRVMASAVIALIAVVAIAVIQRELKNYELGKALHAAEGDRDLDRRMLAAASTISPIGTWSIEVDDDRMDLSDEAAIMHGTRPGDRPLRSEVLSHMDPADAQRLRDRVTRAWESGIPFREEVRINKPDGTHRWIVTMGEKTQFDDGSVARVHGTVQDITLWKEAELAASVLGNRFSQLAKSLPIIIWTADPQGHVDYFNDFLSRYTGLPDEELQNDGWVTTVDPRDIDGVLEQWSEVRAAGSNLDIEYRVRGADGIYRWHHVAAQPERNSSGEIVRWWGSTINVDATRRLREEAEALAAEREIILESMSEGVSAFDFDWRFVYVNASAERILEHTREELLGRTVWEQFPGLEGRDLRGTVAQTLESHTLERFSYRTLTGKWLEISISPSAVGATVFFRDVTEVRQLSEQLAQSQRLEAVGQLTGGIAHDFNNLLTVVLGGADALTADPTLTDDSREMAKLIGSAAERGAELTHRLLAFARRQPLEPQSVDLSERLKQLEPMLRRTLGEHIDIVVKTDGIAPAEVDPGQFENALLNLAINARDAMPDGGTLTIEVGTVTLDEPYVTAHADVAAGTYVAVTVSDSGTGIDPDHMGHLFDPFYTTKMTAQGSGLGLAMVWGFIKQSGGHITVYSELGYGTSFRMYLPPAVKVPVPPRPASVQISTGPLTGTILLAEDDDLVRVFATDRLRAKGYEVVAAASGPAALEALEAIERLDLLFTDVIMPGGMTGRQLADAVVARRPGTPVLYASGYTENVIIHNDRLDPGVKLLAKPYSTRQLVERVGDLLATIAADPS